MTNYIEAAISIYVVLGIATYILMINYRNEMKFVIPAEQMEQAASMSFPHYLATVLMGLILITVFWPLMVVGAFTCLKK